MTDFLTYALKGVVRVVLPVLQAIAGVIHIEFDSFEDVLKLYEDGPPVLHTPLLEELRQRVPFEMIRELLRLGSCQGLLKLPKPQVIQEDETAWRTDEEFTREMLAGLNPVVIRRLEEFPPTSKLDPLKYGDHTSTITAAHIEHHFDGLTVHQALKQNKLFILDHHDAYMPYLNRVNALAVKVYASRTLLFLRQDSTLKPLAIELSLPHPHGEQHGADSKVYTPAESGVEGSIWQLAKAYAAVTDSGYHGLISHWCLQNRSMLCSESLLLFARLSSILLPRSQAQHTRGDGAVRDRDAQTPERDPPGPQASVAALPRHDDHQRLGPADPHPRRRHIRVDGLPREVRVGVVFHVKDRDDKLSLLIEDYPYAVDGLQIWHAIETWVGEYCAIYYPTDDVVKADAELQAWWKEVREVGHGDKKDEPWWPAMDTTSELIEICTTIIWIGSALHAAINFGQYPYAGYLPNRPTMSRRFMPEPGTPEYEELKKNPDKVFLKTITSQLLTVLGLNTIEILSNHSSDEVYLGQRDTPEWTSDKKAVKAFEHFGKRLKGIEAEIMKKNGDPSLKNRNGPAKMPYTLLFPSSGAGITGKGIPNSISI
ncbi:hypothetical protein GW17_00055207 [Ensete ventricosum]|nr:hypothetical protein GW17_00055207 [Ensete ventricosum]